MYMHTPQTPERAHAPATNQAIAIGSTVAIRDLQSGEIEEYTIVTPNQADITHNRISSMTPVGRALYGCQVGDTVDIVAPGGSMQFRIERHIVDTE